MIQSGDDSMEVIIETGDGFMNFAVLDDFEYDIVHYYLIFRDRSTGYKFVYAASHELFSKEVIEQSKKIAEKII